MTVGPLGVGGPRACWQGSGSGSGWRPLRVRSQDRAHPHLAHGRRSLTWPGEGWAQPTFALVGLLGLGGEAVRWQTLGSVGVLKGVKLEHSHWYPRSSGQR